MDAVVEVGRVEGKLVGGLGSVGLSEGPTVDMRECGEEDREGEAVDGVESDAEIVVKVVAFADILSIVNCHIEKRGMMIWRMMM